jgi:hypothetical protein
VSDGITRDCSFTVRLSREEKAELETLADQFGMDKSAAVRRALKQAMSDQRTLAHTGCFVTVGAGDVRFPIRLKGGDK